MKIDSAIDEKSNIERSRVKMGLKPSNRGPNAPRHHGFEAAGRGKGEGHTIPLMGWRVVWKWRPLNHLSPRGLVGLIAMDGTNASSALIRPSTA